MTEHVISHRGPRRKRAGALAKATRRFGMLAVTLSALAVASRLGPYVYRPAPPPIKTGNVEIAAPTPLKRPGEPTKPAARAAPAPERAADARRPSRNRRAVPLDAQPVDAGEDFEVLSASELDAISQARH